MTTLTILKSITSTAITYSKANFDQLRDHMIYLNNHLPDEDFINIFDNELWCNNPVKDYFIEFDCDTKERDLLAEYCAVVEFYFTKNKVSFQTLSSKLAISNLFN